MAEPTLGQVIAFSKGQSDEIARIEALSDADAATEAWDKGGYSRKIGWAEMVMISEILGHGQEVSFRCQYRRYKKTVVRVRYQDFEGENPASALARAYLYDRWMVEHDLRQGTGSQG